MMVAGVRSWAWVGSGAAESLPVVKRLRCLALADGPGSMMLSMDDDEVCFFMHQAGTMHMLTDLETLWVSCSTPAAALGLPSNLRELQLGLGLGYESLDLRFISSLSKLTMLICNATSGSPLLLPTTLEELNLASEDGGVLSVPALPAPLPKLKRFGAWGTGSNVQEFDVANIIGMSKRLEQVRLYVTPNNNFDAVRFGFWTEEYVHVVCLVRKQLAALTFGQWKPIVTVFQLDNAAKKVTETMTL